MESAFREGYEVFQAYLDRQEQEIAEGKPVTLEVRDLTNFTRKVVKAKVSKSKETCPNGVDLWVHNLKDEIEPDPWVIEVIEEMDEMALNPESS
jgi:hypothetical protein